MKRKAPTAAQKRFHDMACSDGCIIPGCGAPARLHHCVGASAKHNKVEIGQWWVLPLCDDHHQHGPAAVHVSPVEFAGLLSLESRKQAEKYLFSALLTRLATDGRDGAVPINVMEAIEGYSR